MTAAALLALLGTLGVSAEANCGALRLRPASAIPADLLDDLRQHKAALLGLLAAPANDPLPVPPHSAEAPDLAALAAACEARGPVLAGAFDAPDVAADHAAVAAEAPVPVIADPPADAIVQALAEAMAANPAHRATNRETAMACFRAEARRRLAATNDPVARGLLVRWERHRATPESERIGGRHRAAPPTML